MIVEIERVFWDRKPGRGVSGVRKMRHLLRREGTLIAKCTLERLMRKQGLRGVRRGEQFITTKADAAAARPEDRVNRDFTACRPNQLWVVDFTYVPTWSGFAFTAFVTDVCSRRILGWRTADRMPTALPLDALEMALWVRGRAAKDITRGDSSLRSGLSLHRLAIRRPARRGRSNRLDRKRGRQL